MGIPESASIPYEANNLRGERLLVLAPHPDDEVIGCGGLVALHLRENRAVHVIVVTDGARAGDADARERESRDGLALLGNATVEFLRYRDRHLETELHDLRAKLRARIDDFKPDLIAVPSPIEIHPDHLALSRAFCELVQRDETFFADHAVARVAFYEVGTPIRPNALVDISAVAALKSKAIAAHASQAAARDYRGYMEGLNAYRGMTLPPDVKFAEAYWLTPLPAIRTMAFSALRDAVGAPKAIEITAEPIPISVIVRTKDRHALLSEAIDSVRKGGYPAEIVIVNDGGSAPQVANATVIHHETSRGRSEAMNAGVRAAKSPYIAFLDDDDLYYPEHLPTLAAAARDSSNVARYTDAVSVFVRDGRESSRMRIFAHEFDADELLLDNYIPIVTLLVSRNDFLDLGGFDNTFDLFEDWDFLIRLSQRGSFAHIPSVTCEIRHIEGTGSITLDSPEGSMRFREAKLRIWKKHAALIDNDVIANVLERQKRRHQQMKHDTVEVRGERDLLATEIARLEREKALLISDVGALHARAAHLDGANTELRSAIHLSNADRFEKNVKLNDLQAEYDDLVAASEEANRTTAALYTEVARLQSLLDMIYESRTWKLHSMVEKMKGRG